MHKKISMQLQDKINTYLDILEQNAIISSVIKKQKPKTNTIIYPVFILAED